MGDSNASASYDAHTSFFSKQQSTEFTSDLASESRQHKVQKPTTFVSQQSSVYNILFPDVSQGGVNSPPLSQSSSSQPHSPIGVTEAHPQIETEQAATMILDDKRRRNTEASARFRIKRKQKSIDLERTVTDLSLRADELEKEASDLRKENAWLKEIVMMKGRNNRRESQAKEPLKDSEKDGESSDVVR